LIETKKWSKAKKTPSQDYSWWGTPEEQELWLTPGSQHYMNATSNSNRNYQLTRSFRDSYVQTRGYEVYDTDKLKLELAAYIEALDEGPKILSVIEPPEAIKALHSLPPPGHWFQCPIDKRYIDTTAFTSEPHPEDHYIQAFHATGITSALHIVYQGHVNAGLGQSAGYTGMVYFFALEKQHVGCRYNAYTFLNDESPYLWSATIECIANRNPKKKAGKNGPQLVQPPNTVALTAVYFHCIHVKNLLHKSLTDHIRVDNRLYTLNPELKEHYIRTKTAIGAHWLIEAMDNM
jgi:hypothetical protein